MRARKSVASAELGFTLVELMVVVAIIGILAAIAIPNFRKYQAKSRTSEAKIILASGYTAMESFYQEYNDYASCFKFQGFVPTGITTAASTIATTNYYSVGFNNADVAFPSGTIPTGCSADATSYYLGTRVPGGATAFSATTMFGANSSIATANSAYLMEAIGIIDPDYSAAASADPWTMSYLKVLMQVRSGY